MMTWQEVLEARFGLTPKEKYPEVSYWGAGMLSTSYEESEYLNEHQWSFVEVKKVGTAFRIHWGRSKFFSIEDHVDVVESEVDMLNKVEELLDEPLSGLRNRLDRKFTSFIGGGRY